MPDAPVLGGQQHVKLDEAAFGARFNGALVHQSVRAEQAARRRGTASTKTRGMVSGGGRKPWRQKGTGRARAGSNRSPLWTGGGTVFGPQPRSYDYALPRKVKRGAIVAALAQKIQDGSLVVIDELAVAETRTRTAAELLKRLGVGGKARALLRTVGYVG